MTLKECYEKMEANYDEVIGRLRSERLVQKFALKFLDDPSYQLLITSMEEKNYEEAFRAAHTIKGVCQNLGFSTMCIVSVCVFGEGACVLWPHVEGRRQFS